MQPEIQRALEAIQQAGQALQSPSQNSDVFRMLLHELTHQEQAGQFAFQQLSEAHQQVSEISERTERMERELEAAQQRIAELERRPASTARDEIIGRAPLHAVETETA